MSFVPKNHTCGARIRAVTLGTGDRATVIGGQNVLPFYSFDSPMEHRPKIGIELSDRFAQWTCPGMRKFYEGCRTLADCARRAETMAGADFLALHFESADPNAENRSVESCVADALAVAQCCSLPIVIMGCHHLETDTALFQAVSEVLRDRNILVLSAREENYRAVGASAGLACGQKVGAETADDINLAKQLNLMLTALPLPAEQIVMNPGTAAVGYGFEYVASTLERIRLAALEQADEDLQIPILAPVSADSWSVKESVASEEEEPAWGSREERGIDMEITTAAATLASGADAVIVRHPAAAAAIRQFIEDLI